MIIYLALMLPLGSSGTSCSY